MFGIVCSTIFRKYTVSHYLATYMQRIRNIENLANFMKTKIFRTKKKLLFRPPELIQN